MAITEEELDKAGHVRKERVIQGEEAAREEIDYEGLGAAGKVEDGPEVERRKYYFDGGIVEIAAHLVLRARSRRQAAARRHATPTTPRRRCGRLCPTARRTAQVAGQTPIARARSSRRWQSAASTSRSWPTQPSSRTPTRSTCSATSPSTRRCGPAASGRERLRESDKDFFERYGPEARAILDELLEKYAEHGDAQFMIPDVLKVPPISDTGNVPEIVALFGGLEALRDAVGELQTLLYAA